MATLSSRDSVATTASMVSYSSVEEDSSVTEYSSDLYSIVHKPKQKKSVSFSSIEIREYPIILGDNPSTSHGPPLTMDWDYQHSQTIKVELFEYCKKNTAVTTKKELHLSSSTRKQRLRTAGYTDEEMQAVEKRVQIERLSREENLPRPNIHFCSAPSFLKQLLFLKKIYRRERSFSVRRSLKCLYSEQIQDHWLHTQST